ncbi:hypothetical protein [Planococcus faecalis]|uniref:Uncharacterized protein n=1 Tax=Planococcus faecalis TaxID=1598147 RepID=A0ABN4XR51_9BACL|nr:hypothetical protein [Planococcus faecalis]AQU79734.1 hypothetical protein AJGP001_10865 [Planococcus faecalis]OHX52069.1 hypothetical protein BB777_14150 [Planococcus faecalis]
MTLNDLVKRKKSEVRYCVGLSNSQLLNLYFFRNRQSVFEKEANVWNVAIIISNSRKQANDWFNHTSKQDDELITGSCGLEGLKKSLDIIIQFRNQLKKNEYLFVRPSDDRRKSAYRRLVNYEFEELYLDGEFHTYASLNPAYWDWIDD